MRTILHIGAHRTGTTSFQAYLRQNNDFLRTRRIGFWGPLRIRKGLFAGIQPSLGHNRKAAKHARGRVQVQLDKSESNGVRTLLISEENMIGTMRRNFGAVSLYRDAGERMARYAMAFDGRIDQVTISIRSLPDYWRSVASFCVARGITAVSQDDLQRLACDTRSWRDVISDVAHALPGVDIVVVPFERTAGRPNAMFHGTTGLHGPRNASDTWLNRSPNAQTLRSVMIERGGDANLIGQVNPIWHPFDPEEVAHMREAYLDDIHWLAAGADGLATLTDELGHREAGQILPRGPLTRGHEHGSQERRVAKPG